MLKILAVDNHPLILRLLESRFTRLGHQVRTAVDGLDALDVLRDFVPDIIFLDLVMPNIGGDQLCRIIRRDPRLIGVYIVILSATAAERECDPATIGADACIAKGPFDRIASHLDTVLAQAVLPSPQRPKLGTLGVDALYQREITRELLWSRKHFEFILNNMTEGLVELNWQHRIIYLNPAATALLGDSGQEPLGLQLSTVLEPNLAAIVGPALAAIAAHGAKHQQVGPGTQHGKQVLIDFFQVDPDQTEAGSIIARIEDITDRYRANENLRRTTDNLQHVLADLHQAQAVMVRQEKLASIGTLASGVAHEILNPLNIISSIVQQLLMDEGSSLQQEQLDEVMNQIRRATKITNNLRMFSRQQEARIVEVDIHALFDKTALLVEYDLNLDNIQLERDFTPDMPLIMADDDQLAQVFLNLINNARAAMRDRQERRITIRTRVVENGITISLSDTGHGIAKENLAKIFDPFFTTKAPGEGTGLGLSLVYSFIENHNGSIEVFSEEGKGTEFFIHLPRNAALSNKVQNHDQRTCKDEKNPGS